MAQKQYSFDFILNAVLNGGFSGTFTKAQQEFIRLGAEIKHLQEIQRDVKAYEKQAAAVQNTSQKLENLKRQYELVNKQIGETTGSTTALEREKLKLEQRITNTEAALEKQKQKLGETKDRLDAAGVSTTDLANKDAELTAKIQELTEEQKKAAEGAGEFGNAGVQAIEAVGGAIAAAGIAEAMKSIADAYSECVEVAGNFEQAMSAVEAIADSNTSEMAALTAEAKELGATTKFTAQQSANAMEYMAMAGWDAQEMLGGMSGVINLAAAAGEDLAQVSDIVTDNLSAFGLKAADTAHFADVLAAAAANSNTNISIMGETFKSSSSVAGALGYSIEDVAVMVGLMANNSVKGSRAGTALRNIFNGLLGGVTLTAKAFGELDYSAVNSDGSMKGLMETVEDLRGYFSQMTKAERVNNAMTIAGMRGYNGLLAILNATNEDFQSLYASINNCSGAAERMAKVKLDNLNGDITLMNSAMEALQSTIGEQFNPELRELTQLKTELLNGLNDFIMENPALVKGLMAGAGAAILLGTGIVGVNAALKAFQALNMAALFTGPAGIALAAAGAAAAVLGLSVAFNEQMKDAQGLAGELRETKKAYQELMDELEKEQEGPAGIAGSLKELLKEENKSAAQKAVILELVEQLNEAVPELNLRYDEEADSLANVENGARVTAEALEEMLEKQAEQEKNALRVERLSELYEEQAEIARQLAEAEEALASAKAKAGEELPAYFDTAADYNEALRESYADEERAVQALTAAQKDNAAQIAELEGAINDYAERQDEAAAQAGEFVTAEQAVRAALDETMASVQALTEAYADAYDEALESFSGQFGLFDEAKADADATVEAAQAALDSQLTYWQGYAANIAVLKEQSADSLHVTEENYNALMEYVRSGTPEAAGLAADMVKAVNDGNTQALTDLADTLGEISASQEEAAGDVAEWTTGLNEQMDQLIRDMKEEIGKLDMSEEAKESGRATVQAYIDQAEGMLPQVRSAYANVARAASLALGPAKYADSAWYANGGRGYASGTANAVPGWSWVGEEGPELMRMHGGEQILPSSVSREVAEDYNAYTRYTAAQGVQSARPPLEVTGTSGAAAGRPKIDLHLHIEAGASPETVNAWQDYVSRGELKSAVLEVMEDADADMRRRAMV